MQKREDDSATPETGSRSSLALQLRQSLFPSNHFFGDLLSPPPVQRITKRLVRGSKNFLPALA